MTALSNSAIKFPEKFYIAASPVTLHSVLLKSRLCKFNLAMPVVSTL